MHTLYAACLVLRSPRARRVLDHLAKEGSALLSALLSPGALVAQVETMGKLRAEADRIEGRQPVRAAVLRRQAERMCLQ